MSNYNGDPARDEIQSISNGDVTVYKTSVGDMSNNCYLLVKDGKALLIDASDNADHLLAMVENAGAELTHVVTTHCHADHVQALGEVLERTGATHITSALDAPDIPAKADRALDQGDTIEFQGLSLPCIILRGHTKGGLAVVLDTDSSDPAHLFVGDSLFPGGVGKTWSEEDFGVLLGDVEKRIFDTFDGSAVVHPGHGADTTVSAERPNLPEWRERGW